MMNEEPVESIDVAGFDLEAWAAGAVKAVETVQVSSKAHLEQRLRELVDAHKAAEKKPGRAAAKRAEVADLAEQIRETAAALEGSWVEVEISVPTPSQRREAFKDVPVEDEEQRVANLLERTARLRPVGGQEWQTLEAAGWLRVFDVIGSGQYDAISTKMATLAFTKGVTPGFSQRALSYLETPRSERS